MRIRSLLAVVLFLVMAAPAHAIDFRAALRSVFGSDQAKDLGLPIFIALTALAALMLYGAMLLGRRRQRREIDAYNARLAAYSASLRKGLK